MEEWMQYARDMAKAEKELEIELWVIISFYRTTEQGGKVLLFRYDLPRKVADKYDWVVRWRRARLTCHIPKGMLHTPTACMTGTAAKTIHSAPASPRWRQPRHRSPGWNGG